METVIKKLNTSYFDEFADIVGNAYPRLPIRSAEDRKKFRKRTLGLQNIDPLTSFYCAFRRNKMIGAMRLHDFTMNLFGTKIAIGGIGLVAVHLLHKKEKVCRDILAFTQSHFSQKRKKMISLYSFRPDFYRKMGYGYGTKINQYRVKPLDLPKGKGKVSIRFLKNSDIDAVVNCYNRFAARKNGLLEKTYQERQLMLTSPNVRVIGFKKGSKIDGYLMFTFTSAKRDNWIMNDINVVELVYNSTDALMEFMSFLHSQADQINNVIFTTHDEALHFLFHDPRNQTNNLIPPNSHETNTQGIGVMYKIIDITGLFQAVKKYSFNNVDCSIKFIVTDSFPDVRQDSLVVEFKKGFPELSKKKTSDVSIKMDIAEFSSLFLGTVNFINLYEYGLCKISDPKNVDTVNRLFQNANKPFCFTAF